MRLGWWSPAREAELRAEARARAIAALNRAEGLPGHHVRHLFTDVLDELPWNVKEQQRQLKEHLERYPDAYPDVPADHVKGL